MASRRFCRGDMRAWVAAALLVLAAVLSPVRAAVPVINSFTSSRAAVGSEAPWQTAFLNWSVSGATSVAIDNGVGNVTGSNSIQVHPTATTRYTLTASNASGSASATVQVNYIPLRQIDASHYQTEHALFIIPDPAQATFPDYDSVFAWSNIDGLYVPELQSLFPDDYFMVVVAGNQLARTVNGQAQYPVPIVTTRRHIADGIGNDAVTGVGVPNICRYNVGTGTVITPAFAVFDHEIGHNWGARLGAEVAAGHWYANSTVHSQLSGYYYDPGFTTAQLIDGDPVTGFTWTGVDNITLNNTAIFADQDLYAMGLHPVFPDTYVLSAPVLNPDNTVSHGGASLYGHAWAVGKHGPRVPGYQASEKQFRLGFVYVARDFNEVAEVYYPVERSIVHYENAEAIDTSHYGFQVPFLVTSQYRASVDARLADLDGNASPSLALTGPDYQIATDGAATVPFLASDPDGPAPSVSLVPASPHATIANGQVILEGLPPGSHFFTLKAEDGNGKKAFVHFVVDVAPEGAFGLSPLTGVNVDATVASTLVVPAEVAAGTPISVYGGDYAINGGAFTSANGIANPGDTISVRQRASEHYSTTTSTTLMIGYDSASFVVTTMDGLSGLAISSGTLSPAFAGVVLDYAAAVGGDVATIAVTPTLADAAASVAVNGTAVASGDTSHSIPLAVGENAITVTVTAAGGATQTYTITVHRSAPTPASTASTITILSHTPDPSTVGAPVDVAVAVGPASPAIQIAAGGAHFCALTGTGGVACWGRNDKGQLGDGGTVARVTPVTVTGLGGNASAVTAGGAHTCALVAGGVACWGDNSGGQLGAPPATVALSANPLPVPGLASGVTAIAAGNDFTCAVVAGGVKCWGDNVAGQLGDGNGGSGVSTPTPNPIDVNFGGVAPTGGIAGIGAAYAHACAVDGAGHVSCWGHNNAGQLGDGTTVAKPAPVAVAMPAGFSAAKAVGGGLEHSCALTDAGAVWCWGGNFEGQLGDGSTSSYSTVPVAASGLGSGVLALSAGFDHNCVVTAAGAVQCWAGLNMFGEAGAVGTSPPVATTISGLASGFAQVAAGDVDTCAATLGGAIVCWGRNDNGQLGDASLIDRATPGDVWGYAVPTGHVDVSGSHTAGCTLTLANGMGGCQLAYTGAGTQMLTATYGGDAAYAGSAAATSQTVNAASAVAVLASLAQTYDGAQKSATCVTTPSGLATSLSYSDIGNGTGRINAGSYGVTCSVTHPGYTGTASGTLVIAKAGQAITFAALPNKTLGGADFTVAATASSGLAVTFASQTAGVCSVSGNTVHLVATGSCVLRASQAGNGNYNAAAAVDRSFNVSPGLATVILGNLAQTYDGAVKSASCATTPPGLATSLAYSDAGSGTGRINAGNYGVNCAVTQAGYTGSAGGTLVIAKASQTIVFSPPASKTLGDPPFPISATASSGMAVGFASQTATVCTVAGTTVTLLKTGTCTLRASQPGNGNYKAAANVDRNIVVNAPVVSLGNLSQTYSGTVKSASCATTPAGLATRVIYNDVGYGVGRINSGNYGVTCKIIQAGYTGSASGMLMIAKANQTIAFPAPPSSVHYVKGGIFKVSATASSGLAVKFSSLTKPVCTVLGATVTMTAAGTCTIAANQAGNRNYNAAPQVTRGTLLQ